MTRRAVVDLVRTAVLGSYGVTGFARSPLGSLLARLGLRDSGIRVRLDAPLSVELHLRIAYGLPVAEVARQVESAVRYSIRRTIGREVERLTIVVGGLAVPPAGTSAGAGPGAAVAPGTEPASAPEPGEA